MSDIDLTEFYDIEPALCKIAKTLNTISTEDKEKFEAAMLEPTITVVALTKWLSVKKSDKVAESTVRKHRRQECSCYG